MLHMARCLGITILFIIKEKYPSLLSRRYIFDFLFCGIKGLELRDSAVNYDNEAGRSLQWRVVCFGLNVLFDQERNWLKFLIMQCLLLLR